VCLGDESKGDLVAATEVMAMTARTATGSEDVLVEDHRVGEALLASLVRRDFSAVEACFDPGIQFRALIPPGVREAANAEDTVGYLRRWFGEAVQLQLLQGQAETIGDRLHVRYRLLVDDADGRQVVEQQTYCDVEDSRIVRMDLLCSGFRPYPAPERPARPGR
jgi:hypothetical protein